MHNIKTRQSRKDIKAFDKTTDLSRRLQNTYIRTKDQTEHPEHDNYVNEAAEKVQDTAKGIGRKASRVVGWAGKNAIRKIRASRAGSPETETNDDTHTPGSCYGIGLSQQSSINRRKNRSP